MQPNPNRSLMRQSPPFRAAFCAAVIFSIAAIGLGIAFNVATCYKSCQQQYWSTPIECTNYGLTYCCSYSYSTCGGAYCFLKPSLNYGSTCTPLWIATWVCSGVALICFLTMCIIMRNLRRRAAMGLMAGAPNNYMAPPNQYYGNPNYANDAYRQAGNNQQVVWDGRQRGQYS